MQANSDQHHTLRINRMTYSTSMQNASQAKNILHTNANQYKSVKVITNL